MRAFSTHGVVVRCLILTCAALAVMPLPATAQTSTVPPGAQPQPPTYLLGPGDVLEVSVWGYPDLTRTVTVRPDGKISLPLIGSAGATGVTAEQLRRTLTKAFAVYIRQPVVTVIVTQFRVIQVAVLGQVTNPGAYALPPGSRVLRAIAAAGGIVNSASVKEVQLIDRDRKIRSLLTDALLRGEARYNPELLGGETILVPEIRKLSASVIGQVVRPGIYEFVVGATILDLITMAGGLTEAALKQGQLLRSGEAPVTVDLERVLTGDASANPVLRAGDALVVPEDLVSLINVVGEVNTPGRYRLKPGMRVLDVLLLAGGLTERGSVTDARLLRGKDSLPLHLDAVLFKNDTSQNTLLQPGDTLFIPEDTRNRIYVLGDVRAPGVFQLKGEMTLVQALALAGGVVPRGLTSARMVQLVRRSGPVPEALKSSDAKIQTFAEGGVVVTMRISTLARGAGREDIALRPGDVILVPESTGLLALQTIVAIIVGLTRVGTIVAP